MAGMIRKKGHIIGAGRPLICVPVVKRKSDEIIAEIKTLVSKNVQMIEWRIDFFEKVEDAKAVLSILKDVEAYLDKTLLVVTFRSKKQGGEKQLSSERILELYGEIASCKVVDFIDLEYFEYEKPKKAIEKLQRMGVYVISSHHDFQETPPEGVLLTLLEKMYMGGADIVKLAVMPKTSKDVLNLMEATSEFVHAYPEALAITMSMGSLGMISRVSGESFGSCVTFGSHETASAPGQLQMDDLATVLDLLHKSM